MRIDIPQDAVRLLSKMTPEEQREWMSKCDPETILLIDAAFEAWAARGQIEPSSEGWRVWLMMAGRGFGKTRAGAEWIYRLAWTRPVRIALVAASMDEARAIMIDGRSGLVGISKRQRHNLKWEPSLNRLTWPRGSVAQLYSGDHADGLRGPEHHFAWCPAGTRRGGGGCGRRASAGVATRLAGGGKLLYRGDQPERGVVGPCPAVGGLH